MYHGLTVNWCNLKENILLVQKEIKIKVVLKGDEGGDGVERCKFLGKRGILQVRGA